jgi:hypothetical protein
MKPKIAWSCGLAIVLVAGVALFTRMAVRSAPPYAANFAADVQAGIASEAPCPTTSGGVPQAVENAASFITYRSGVNLSDQVKQKLRQLEQSTLSGSTDVTGLSRQQVKDVITATIMNAVSSVTDAQIGDMAKSNFRVLPCFTDANRPAEVQLRASKGNFDSSLFQQKAIEFRDGSTSEGLNLRTMAPGLIGQEVDSRLDGLAYACPTQWQSNSYSPYRVFLLAYALVSDDLLVKSQTQVVNQMQGTENWLYTNRGISCPSAGRVPFGDHGYMYCTPMSIFFSQVVQNDLLTRIQTVIG